MIDRWSYFALTSSLAQWSTLAGGELVGAVSSAVNNVFLAFQFVDYSPSSEQHRMLSLVLD